MIILSKRNAAKVVFVVFNLLLQKRIDAVDAFLPVDGRARDRIQARRKSHFEQNIVYKGNNTVELRVIYWMIALSESIKAGVDLRSGLPRGRLVRVVGEFCVAVWIDSLFNTQPGFTALPKHTGGCWRISQVLVLLGFRWLGPLGQSLFKRSTNIYLILRLNSG